MNCVRTLSALALTLAAAAAVPAQAAAILTFEAGAATPLAAGAVAVPIYLHETLTDGSASTISPDGLYSIGVRVDRTAGDATIASFARNAAFDTQNPGSSTSLTSALLSAEQGANFGNGVDPDANGRILFATATIQLGTSASTFSIADFGPNAQIVDYDAVSHDAAVNANGPYAFAVSAVPEPTTLAALAGAGLLALRRRR